MTGIDGIAGMYNLLIEDEFDIADHKVPMDLFVEMLEERDLPEEIAVSGVDDALCNGNDQAINELTVAMREGRDYLDSSDPLPVIQFVFDGEFQSTGESYELFVDDQFHSLSPIFGRNIRRQEPGWVVTSLRV